MTGKWQLGERIGSVKGDDCKGHHVYICIVICVHKIPDSNNRCQFSKFDLAPDPVQLMLPFAIMKTDNVLCGTNLRMTIVSHPTVYSNARRGIWKPIS